jgi:hypothetical protein
MAQKREENLEKEKLLAEIERSTSYAKNTE